MAQPPKDNLSKKEFRSRLDKYLQKTGPSPPFKPQDYELAFVQANRSLSGMVSMGELWCHVVEECSQPPEAVAALWLVMDLDGDGKLSPAEWKVGYRRYASQYGLRPKVREGEKYEYGRSASTIEGFEKKLTEAMAPMVTNLQAVFDMIDLDKDKLVSARELNAFRTVLERRILAELNAAEEAKAEAAAEAGEKYVPPEQPYSATNGPPARMQAVLGFNMADALSYLCEEQGCTQEPPVDKWGEVALPFERFRAYLARHPEAFMAVAPAGKGGKKGKKKK